MPDRKTLKQKKLEQAIEKELLRLEEKDSKRQKKIELAIARSRKSNWKKQIEDKLPAKVYQGLHGAFCKGFAVVFQKGSTVIEKSFSKESLQEDYAIQDYIVQIKGGRKPLKQIRKNAKTTDSRNLAITTVEGIGLGALGIGLPDIVLFLGTLLKGIYEVALHYGYEYESREEKIFILQMMGAALCSDEAWYRCNERVEGVIAGIVMEISEEDFEAQIQETAAMFAMDMLLLKFIQGLPIVGIIGGAANPVYYQRVLNYVKDKYHKRYLIDLRKRVGMLHTI